MKLTEVRQAVYAMRNLPSDENKNALKRIEEKSVDFYGEEITSLVIASANRTIDDRQKRIRFEAHQ